MNEHRSIRRTLAIRLAVGFPWGAAGIYLIFLLGNLFSIPAPADGMVRVVSDALSSRWGSPVTAALVQFLWAGILGAVLSTAGLPFLIEQRTLLWSGLHFLLTALIFSLAGWRCGWFPYTETWLLLLGLLLLCYLLMWAIRWIGWRQDLKALRRAAGLPVDGAGSLYRKRGGISEDSIIDSGPHREGEKFLRESTVDSNPENKNGPRSEDSTIDDSPHREGEKFLRDSTVDSNPENKDGPRSEDSTIDGGPHKEGEKFMRDTTVDSNPKNKNGDHSLASSGRRMASWLLLAAAVELVLPWLLRAVDARDVPVLTGLFYPFLILPLFSFLSAHAAGRRCRFPWVLLYAVSCGLLTVPNVFLLYNYTALFHVWTAGIAALLGGILGLLRTKIKS